MGGRSTFFNGNGGAPQGHVGAASDTLVGAAIPPGEAGAGDEFGAPPTTAATLASVLGRLRSRSSSLRAVAVRSLSGYCSKNARYAVAHDYVSFVHEEMQGRVDPLYPPNLRLANIVFSGLVEDSTAKLAIHAGEWLRELITTRAGDEITVVGPAPCPIERIKNRWRWHILLKSDQPGELTRVGRYFMERFEVPSTAQLRVTLDRDPVALL